jgi:hypothetical protein
MREINVSEICFDILEESFLVFLEAEHVIGVFFDDLVCNFVLAALGL